MISGFGARLRERKVIQWSVAYLAVAWGLLQGLDFLSDNFGWTAGIVRAATAFLAVGFLGALVVAWYHGERGQQRVLRHEIVLLGAILGAAGAAAWYALPQTAADPAPDTAAAKSIAVLPFANVTPQKENDYLASGIHSELLTQLAKVGDLSVISRTSVIPYAGNTGKSLKQIARELGVRSIVEGTVQRAGDRIKVEAQLIDAESDAHLWAETFQEDLTDLFAVQSAIAEAIAAALRARLTAGERAALAHAPTRSSAAYEAYLQAEEYSNRPGESAADMYNAIRLYERAIALDSTFALAYARLSHNHGRLHWYAFDRTPARLEQQRRAAEKALALQPQIAEAHLAQALYYYWGLRQYAKAIAEFNEAARLAPGDPQVTGLIAAVRRRQGLYDESIAGMLKSMELSPRDARWARNLGETYRVTRQYEKAIAAYDRALELGPDMYDAASERGWTFTLMSGTLDSVALAIRGQGSMRPGFAHPAADRFFHAYLRRDRDEVLRAAQNAPEQLSAQQYFYPRALLLGLAHELRGEAAQARQAFAAARTIAQAAVRTDPADPRFHLALGHALAGLGVRDEAARHARRVMEVMPPQRDAFFATLYADHAALLLAKAGDVEAALPLLQRQLAGPGNLSVPLLGLHPFADPIRHDPRVQRLLQSNGL